MSRLLVVILEGMTPSLLDRWMAAGGLPTLTLLKKQGVWGDFESLPVPYEPSALMSVMTGLPPGEHGCFSYWHVHGDSFSANPEVVRSNDIQTPFFWQRPKHLKSGIVNVFGTHPPLPMNGNLISYPLKPSLRASYPPELLRELSAAGISYGHDVSALYTGKPKEEFVPFIERVEEARARACLEIMARGGDFFLFNITLVERLSHFWWHEVEASSNMDDVDTVLWRAYHRADRILGRLRDRLEAGDNLMVFSEIGFGPLKAYVSVNDILAEAGLLCIQDGVVNSSKSVAMEAVQGSHGINLNLKRRHRDSWITENEEERYMEEVRQALAAATIDGSQPLFRNILPGHTLYPGSLSQLAPDLILEPHDERYLPLGHPFWAHKVKRHLQTGWHRRNSFWAGMGPRFKSSTRGAKASCFDLAQTMASCLDLAPPSVHGTSLT